VTRLDDDLPVSEKLLLIMHNLCAVRPEISRTSNELSKAIDMTTENIIGILNRFESEGYVKSIIDQNGQKKFYLTGRGILKVCSSFT
jgi:DNA-binding MarR family transcriptional regulator